MAHINEEQVLELINMNARDYFTIFTVTMERMDALLADYQDVFGRLRVSPTFSDLASITTTQFIELKRGKNFGAVHINSKDDKKEEKPNPEPKPDYTIRDPESPMTPGQKEGIEKLMNIPGAPKLINTYRETHDIKGGWDTANKGQASDIMDLLIQLGKEKKKEGDKQ